MRATGKGWRARFAHTHSSSPPNQPPPKPRLSVNPDDLVCLLLPPPPPSKMLLDYIKDTKNNDALKEKLCVRLENVHDAREWQNLVFCLTSLQYRYKSGTLGVGRQYRSIVLGGGGGS